MMLMEWKNGDVLYRYRKALVLVMAGERRVLSTSVLNGGYREDIKTVFNHDANPGAGIACRLEAETYEAHLALIAERLGLAPQSTTGLSTAASMENVAICTESYRDLSVTAIVTGGVEVNGGRVGDPSDWYEPAERKRVLKPGTINTIVVFNVDLLPGVLARALVTATEAKTAALQELMANSNYSTGIATGSGTDGTVMVADKTSVYCLENAGKHSKLGELIGKAVIRATKEALAKQSGFTPKSMHRLTKRLKRYGITDETMWQMYVDKHPGVPKYIFMDRLAEWESANEQLVPTIMLIHLADEYQWGLIDTKAFVQGASLLGMKVVGKEITAKSILCNWISQLLNKM